MNSSLAWSRSDRSASLLFCCLLQRFAQSIQGTLLLASLGGEPQHLNAEKKDACQ